MKLDLSRINPKQVEFFRARARHVAYGGARGGGKSWAMRMKFTALAIQYPGLKLLLLRRTLPELRENHLLPLLALLTGFAKYKGEERAFLFPNGSRLKLGYCDNEKDVFQYQGQEYDVVGFEEATLFTEASTVNFTAAAARMPAPGKRPPRWPSGCGSWNGARRRRALPTRPSGRGPATTARPSPKSSPCRGWAGKKPTTTGFKAKCRCISG
ncbi:MAG TPA: terminase family protein [Selenomonadales bacterium]|nr:terminase family protein [Selenomonadales bacterium]